MKKMVHKLLPTLLTTALLTVSALGSVSEAAHSHRWVRINGKTYCTVYACPYHI